MEIKRKKLRVFNILFLLVVTSLIVRYSALAYDLNEYFPLEDSDRWVYLEKINEKAVNCQGLVKVKGVEKVGEVETKIMASVLDDSQCVFVDSGGVKLYKTLRGDGGDYILFNPPKMLYPNIEIGEKKEYPINSAIYNLLDVLDEATREVGILTINLDSVEDVEVPAGKFTNCLKFISVSNVGKADQAFDNKMTSVSWLAPGVGLVKQSLTINQLNRKTNAEETTVKERELASVVIAGKAISGEPSPTTETPPQVSEPSLTTETPLQEKENQTDKIMSEESNIGNN